MKRSKTSPANKKRRLAYTNGRALLIKEMGGACRDCGASRNLEFHHKYIRTWDIRKASRWQRLAYYRREWSANAIELLCKSCNAKRGEPMTKHVLGENEFVPVKNVKLHPDRFYRDKLDVEDLIRSMGGPNGQLQSIGIDTSGFLLWGRRRLEAARKLGWQEIMARIIDLESPLRAIEDENACRCDLTVSEKVALAKAIEESEKGKARRRQAAAGGDKSASENFSQAQKHRENEENGRAKAKAAEAAGMSRPTYEKAKEVIDAAAADPSKNGIVEEMDSTGNVSAAHRKIKEPETQIKDAEGQPVPMECEAAFLMGSKILEECRRLDTVALAIEGYAKQPGGEMLHVTSLIQSIRNIRKTLYASRATHLCPYCSPEVSKKCNCCKGRGWTTKTFWEQAPKKNGNLATTK